MLSRILLTLSSILDSDISVRIVSGSLTKGATLCTFNVSARREYGGPITNMTSRHFGFLINGSNCGTAAFTEGETGIYNFSCSSSTCVSSSIVANVTDTRNIVGYDVNPNTGLGYT